ncbi:F0F1 ATP synthase subunit B [Rickettsia prowazekii]|uniref:ATP synthase subunit b n=2 Tax=Rickettsia prowazekii TaxID=782 RepID=ATPF_RICPR|nr:F0F1 ATP synthase subunit B [Rickettsia prowazekii]Q9ZEC4.1 RecName: Full=ATP synthase subunit b; AltName: Full=ATP synthase F(0) sector subunit b; AltName: Full=ATPase subunit I; AltName: Full=F-type ATPase subunit b; Short=F-ATPase subunit b [Rickettsia prowazekii str. Madrid E]EOB10158.1 ATP synthase B chain [Rickettsia prowazekii str. GvF12]ADE29530.1 ATP synthase B chain [Rickettsia prowazekii str. Rp22]AFE48851.1 F0F1 ATP synthase subunit B [Rickettsia prowazekii str. Chernikova]AFE49
MNFLDESFWLTISFVIFVYLIYRPAKKAILNALDTKISEIQEKVLKAKKLKEDAALLFEQTKLQIQKLETLRSQMIEESDKATKQIIQDKTKEMEEFLERKKADAIQLIQNQKSTASKDLQDEFCDEVITLVSKYFRSAKLSEKSIAKNLMDKSDFVHNDSKATYLH